jgi:hypothetical protein
METIETWVGQAVLYYLAIRTVIALVEGLARRVAKLVLSVHGTCTWAAQACRRNGEETRQGHCRLVSGASPGGRSARGRRSATGKTDMLWPLDALAGEAELGDD